MSGELSWQRKESTLSLQGELVHSSLLPLWQQRQQLLPGIAQIDLARLSRVDSAGLALLVHFKSMGTTDNSLHFFGISPALHSLITLYNLQTILFEDNSALTNKLD